MSLTQYLEELNEACVYANECVPDVPFAHVPGPFLALFCIAAVCFFVWAWNERGIKRQLAAEAEFALAHVDNGAQELKRVADSARPTPAVAPQQKADLRAA